MTAAPGTIFNYKSGNDPVEVYIVISSPFVMPQYDIPRVLVMWGDGKIDHLPVNAIGDKDDIEL